MRWYRREARNLIIEVVALEKLFAENDVHLVSLYVGLEGQHERDSGMPVAGMLDVHAINQKPSSSEWGCSAA